MSSRSIYRCRYIRKIKGKKSGGRTVRFKGCRRHTTPRMPHGERGRHAVRQAASELATSQHFFNLLKGSSLLRSDPHQLVGVSQLLRICFFFPFCKIQYRRNTHLCNSTPMSNFKRLSRRSSRLTKSSMMSRYRQARCLPLKEYRRINPEINLEKY